MNGRYITAIFLCLMLFLNIFISISNTHTNDFLEDDNVEFNSYDYEIYYQNVEFLSGEQLHVELYDIIRNHTVISYSSVWDHLREVDEDPLNNVNVILFYMQRSQSENDTCGDGNECTSQSWNREHVWPKSHGDFGTSMTKVAGTDLHSLRPVDNTVNSARSDKDFGNATDSHWECIECESSTDYWEPSEISKGDAARSVFYMDVRYNGYGNEPNLSLVNGTTQPSSIDGYLGDLCTLYDWHLTDPVSPYEINRNNEIFDIQGNRNPFIDNENFVQEIWGNICEIQDSGSDMDNDGFLDSEDICPEENSIGFDLNLDGCLDDTDGDGVTDNLDIFPLNHSESHDSDLDGIGDNSDAFPNNPLETKDSDSDGVGDNADKFPNDSSEWIDTDSDGIGDNSDAFPLDPLENIDSDSDGVGDNSDMFPFDNLESIDSDLDGVGDNADKFPNDSSEWIDTDSDGIGDNSDAFPLDPLENIDSDSDGVGDNSDIFPLDSKRYELENSNNPVLILIFTVILVVFITMRSKL